MAKPELKELLEFPCEYPLTVMGPSEGPFKQEVLEILQRHVPHLDPSKIRSRESRKGTYLSLRIPFTATSRDPLDALYRELTSCSAVSVAL